jgi:hypothetical protein
MIPADAPRWAVLAATQAEVLRGLAIAAAQDCGLDLRECLLETARKFIDIVAPSVAEVPTGENVVSIGVRKNHEHCIRPKHEKQRR